MNLLTNTPKTVLAEIGVLVGGVETTRYLSTNFYIDESTTPPTIYNPILSWNIQTTETISIDGSPSFSFSDLEIYNQNGEYDEWLLDVWANRPVKLFIGEIGQARNTFTLIFDGLVADIDTKSRTTLNIKVRDKLQRLNTPLTETVLGGLTENAQAVLPYTFGECFNVSPLLIDQGLLKYKVCGSAIEDIIEVRVNGAPVAITKGLANGEFTLNRRPNGDVTCSVQGRKPSGTYNRTIATVIKDIVLNFGKPGDKFQLTDIDTTNFNAFNAANPQTIGYYVNSKENIISVAQEIASSVQGQVLCNRLGKLQLHQITLSGTPNRVITEADMVEKTLVPSERPEVQSTIMLNYCKNWTPQTGLQTGIANQSRSILANDWRLVTSTDAAIQAKYKQTTYPEPTSSLLVNKAEAQAEAARRLALWKEQRTVFSFNGVPTTTDLTIGQTITLKHPRFNLSAGKTGLIIGVTINWKTLKTNIQVLV